MPGARPGNRDFQIGLESEAGDLFLGLLTIALLDDGKNAGNSNEPADHVQIFHLPISFHITC